MQYSGRLPDGEHHQSWSPVNEMYVDSVIGLLFPQCWLDMQILQWY